MGCAASSRIKPHPAQVAEDEKATAEFERQLANARAAQEANTNAALRFGQQFELTTPMLVMPFGVFKAQGRIMKSTKAWRDEALAAGSLVEHEEGSSQIVIFISHTWWDRSYKDGTNDPNDLYDKGAPDWQTGENKNLKWRVICAGVQRLLEQEGLKVEEVSLWVDWQSIYQGGRPQRPQAGLLASSPAWCSMRWVQHDRRGCFCAPAVSCARAAGAGYSMPAAAQQLKPYRAVCRHSTALP